MGRYSRFEILGQDRVGITLDILGRFCSRGINLVSVEVFPGRLCIMTDELSPEIRKQVNAEISQIQDVTAIRDIELLNREKDEKKLMAVIDSVDEGVIAIDSHYGITIFNNYCEELFGCPKESVLGTDIRNLIGSETLLAGMIEQGEDYDHLEAIMESTSGQISYVSSGRTIRDDNGMMIGAVASIKDTNKVRELASIISTEEEAAFKEIIGNSRSLEQIKKTICTVARSNSTVMLRGESGTGKELFARAIHELSGRKGSYVTLNCAALPESLLESELFGYEKGSFTGAAASGKAGLFSEANGGTLFLDEIGELTPVIQAKLLRVLQDGKVRRVGGNREELVDVRVVVATNRNLEDMMQNRLFREDLYYRLNVIPIAIPNLNSRREDIPLLVHFFVQKLNRKLNRSIVSARQDFINYLMQQEWPGNIRQMQNVVERAMNLCEGEVLTLRDLYLDNPAVGSPISQGSGAQQEGETPTLREAVERCEQERIRQAMQSEKSCRSAAKKLGVSHTTLLNKLKRYKIMWQ